MCNKKGNDITGYEEQHWTAVVQQAWRDTVSEEPLPNSDLVLYVDGSCYMTDSKLVTSI